MEWDGIWDVMLRPSWSTTKNIKKQTMDEAQKSKAKEYASTVTTLSRFVAIPLGFGSDDIYHLILYSSSSQILQEKPSWFLTMGDDWDDLFAKAEGHTASASGASQHATVNRKRSYNQQQRESYQSYIDGRWDCQPEMPAYLTFAGSFTARDCSVYSTDMLDKHKNVCKHCGLAFWQHWAVIQDALEPLAALLCALRNLRCVAIQAALDAMGKGHGNRLSKTWKKLKGHWKTLQQGLDEEEIREKALNVTECITKVQRTLANNEGHSMETEALHAVIRLIIACDSIYYSIYYQHISGGVNVPFFFPHPVSYFGLIASPSLDQKKELAPYIHFKNIKPSETELIQQTWGLEPLEDKELHPLLVIHRHRLMETRLLFRTLPFDMPTKTKQLELHDTVGPDILMEWRDSSRDFICHLYAYATVSPSSVRALAKVMVQELGSSTILELGAGTGYLAQVLKDNGLKIYAYDVAPTSTDKTGCWNEYHGRSPQFLLVHQGDEGVLRKHGHIHKSVLLLCYPPPDSNFAEMALKLFARAGGRLLIFIGEFKGLTGSCEFETCLVNSYQCIKRIPCYCWGTDASTFTVWKKRSGLPEVDVSLLVPCSHCKTKEATRRCRLLRILCYCDVECFENGREARDAHLQIACVRLGSTTLDFSNASHFSLL